MKVTRNVILDLLPLCHAGEASDDTRDLVAAFAAQDPEIARLLTAPAAIRLPAPPETLEKETEMRTLKRTRTFLKWRTILLGGSSVLTLFAVLILAMAATCFYLFDARVASTWWPVVLVWGLMTMLVALAAWVAYFVFHHHYSS